MKGKPMTTPKGTSSDSTIRVIDPSTTRMTGDETDREHLVRLTLGAVVHSDHGEPIHDADLLEVSYCYGEAQVEINVALSEIATLGLRVEVIVWEACDSARRAAREASPW